MVYQFIPRNPYSSRVGTRIIDTKDGDMPPLSFLDPSSVPSVFRTGFERMAQGYPIVPATAPKAIRWESKVKKAPDVFMSRGGVVASQTVRAIVERFEPGVHQFIPVDLYRPKAEEPFAQGFWMVVCRRIDSVDEAHTPFPRFERSKLWHPSGDGHFVYSLTAIGTRIAGAILTLPEAFFVRERWAKHLPRPTCWACICNRKKPSNFHFHCKPIRLHPIMMLLVHPAALERMRVRPVGQT